MISLVKKADAIKAEHGVGAQGDADARGDPLMVHAVPAEIR
jgi:hypothetical protein